MVEKEECFKFKCGEMEVVNTKVKPKKDAGFIKVYFNSDKILCWQWFSEDANQSTELVAIFADEWEWLKVPVNKGRVYQLKSKCFEESYFYWLQDPDTSKDSDLSQRITHILNTGDIKEKSEEVKTHQQMDVEKTTEVNSNTQFILDQITSVLRKSKILFKFSLEKQPGLRKILSSSNIKSFLSSEEFIKRALQHLPEGQNKTDSDYLKNVTSPQFHDALNSLSSALGSENFELILTSFGLKLSETKGEFGVEGLINSLINRKNDEEKK